MHLAVPMSLAKQTVSALMYRAWNGLHSRRLPCLIALDSIPGTGEVMFIYSRPWLCRDGAKRRLHYLIHKATRPRLEFGCSALF